MYTLWFLIKISWKNWNELVFAQTEKQNDEWICFSSEEIKKN